MSERLTTEQLEAIRERAEAATEGKWWVEEVGGDYAICAPSFIYGEMFVTTQQGDAEFISKSREDIPALLAEVERLRKRGVSMDMTIYGLESEVGRLQEQLNRIEERVLEAIRNE